jgi:4-amino-4-deoxy-L-arabinose transferase-like glycosyltransferase
VNGRLIEGWRGFGLLTILCLVLYLPGLTSLPPTDRDESRFAQATRQMLETHDFIRIHFQDEARNKKPAGIYWLQAVSVALLSDAESNAIWPYRLPSLAGAIAAVLLTCYFGTAWFGRETAFLSAMLLAASVGLIVEAHLAKTDAALLAVTTAAQGALGEIYRRTRRDESIGPGLPVCFWVTQSLGLLIKGPITPLISLLTILALGAADRETHWLRQLRVSWGLPLALLIAGPWFAAIIFATKGQFLRDSVGQDLFAKLVAGQEGHGAPPGTYLILALIMFWPGSLILGKAALHGWRERSDPATRFLIAWIVPFWLVLELAPTKLPNYILPVYPALAMLCALAWQRVSPAGYRRGWLDLLVKGLWGVVTLALAAALIVIPFRIGHPLYIPGGIGALALIGFGVLFFRESHGSWKRASYAVFASAALSLGAFSMLSSLDALWLSRSAAQLIASQGFSGRKLVVAGYAEPSLVFLLGTDTRLTGPEEAAAVLAQTPSTLALIGGRDEAAFQAASATAGDRPVALGQIDGFDFSKGKTLTLTLYRRAGTESAP